MSANTLLYHRRKALGVCVRCEAALCPPSRLCEKHLIEARARRKVKEPDDAPYAIPAQPEPPRPPYKSETEPVFPPIPKRCPRCKGLICNRVIEWPDEMECFCFNCGWRLVPMQPDPKRVYGAQLTVITEVRR